MLRVIPLFAVIIQIIFGLLCRYDDDFQFKSKTTNNNYGDDALKKKLNVIVTAGLFKRRINT